MGFWSANKCSAITRFNNYLNSCISAWGYRRLLTVERGRINGGKLIVTCNNLYIVYIYGLMSYTIYIYIYSKYNAYIHVHNITGCKLTKNDHIKSHV